MTILRFIRGQLIPAVLAQPGDTIAACGAISTATRVQTFMPGELPEDLRSGCPIKWETHIVRVVTAANGWNRFFGHVRASRYYGAEVLGCCPDGVSFEE
jgi:hypothetical protein